MKEGYIPKEQRKKILLLCDDIRMTSGISTMAREIVIGTAHHYNWVNVGGAIQHPDKGKRFDLSEDTGNTAGIKDASVFLYPTDGYGSPELIRQLIQIENPDAIMFFTDPRYWVWLFQMEHEIRKTMPMIYLNIWDDLPYPMYNKSFYESCDTLFAISKQTENINRCVLGAEISAEKIIKYIPHGINENIFFPINSSHPEYLALQDFKKQVYSNKEYDFNLLYNARNIRRKSVPDLMLAWKILIDTLPEDREMSQQVRGITDILSNEPMQLRIGPEIVEKIRFALPDEMYDDENKGLVPWFYSILYKTPAKEFLEIIGNAISEDESKVKKATAKFKEIMKEAQKSKSEYDDFKGEEGSEDDEDDDFDQLYRDLGIPRP